MSEKHYSVMSDECFNEIIEAKESGVANLLEAARKEMPWLSLYEIFGGNAVKYRGRVYRFFFNSVTMRQDFQAV